MLFECVHCSALLLSEKHTESGRLTLSHSIFLVTENKIFLPKIVTKIQLIFKKEIQYKKSYLIYLIMKI